MPVIVRARTLLPMPEMSARRRARRLSIILTTLLAVALGARFAYTGVVPNLFPKRFHTVDPGKVYRSGQLTPAAFESVIREHKIRTIIDLGSTIHGQAPGERRNHRAAEALGVTRYVFHLYGDSSGNPNEYIQALRLASDPANQPVLIHCGAGTERTGFACLLYKAHHFGTPIDEGFREAQSVGHNPRRTPMLRTMIDKWVNPILVHLREGGQIQSTDFPTLPDPVPDVTP